MKNFNENHRRFIKIIVKEIYFVYLFYVEKIKQKLHAINALLNIVMILVKIK